MLLFHKTLLFSHIIAGSLALLLVWLALLAKKGSPLHVRAGQFYSYLMHIVGISGVLMCTLVLAAPLYFKAADLAVGQDPQLFAQRVRLFAGFLLLLSLLSLMNLRQGLLALRAGPARQALRHGSHQLLVLLTLLVACYVGWQGIRHQHLLSQIFAAVALLSGVGCLRYSWRGVVDRTLVLREHIGNMLASMIAVYTAFFAFGGRAVLALDPAWQLISWLAPTVVGISMTLFYNRKYASGKVAAGKTAAAR
jgi:uncharacterized membrane protein